MKILQPMPARLAIRVFFPLAIALWSGCATPACGGEEAGGFSPTDWISLFDGENLGDWSPSEFLVQGDVSIDDGMILLGIGDGLTGITWKGEDPLPRVNYEIALDARRVSGGDFFCGLTFPVKETHVTLIVGGWGGSLVGISNVDSADASANETTNTMRFERGRWYNVRVRVDEDRICAWIDECLVIDLNTRGRSLDIRPDVANSRPLGIAAWNTIASLRNIRIRRLDP